MEKYSEMRYNDRVNNVANAKRCDFMIPKAENTEKMTITEAIALFRSLGENEKREVIKFMEEIRR